MTRLGITIATVASIAAVAVALLTQTDTPSPGLMSASITTRSAKQMEWRPTPKLPGRLTEVSHASIVSSGGKVFVALSLTRHRHELLSVWQLDGGHWAGPLGGKSWKVNTDIETKLVDLGGPCIDPTAPNGRVRVYCFSEGGWAAKGGQVYVPTPSSIATDFFSTDGQLYVVRVNIPKPKLVGNVGFGGRAETHLFQLSGGKWIEPRPGDVATGLDGSQRAFGVPIADSPCVVFDSTPGPRISGDQISVRVRCPQSGKWKDALPPLRQSGVRAINNDGVTQVGASSFVGTDLFVSKGIRWGVFAGTAKGWKKTKLAVDSSYWNSQGSLFRVERDVWSVQFDQHDVPGGYRARIFVRALNPDTGKVVQVGRMLVPAGPIYNLVSFGLAHADGWEYALFSSPNRRTMQQSVKVSRIRLEP